MCDERDECVCIKSVMDENAFELLHILCAVWRSIGSQFLLASLLFMLYCQSSRLSLRQSAILSLIVLALFHSHLFFHPSLHFSVRGTRGWVSHNYRVAWFTGVRLICGCRWTTDWARSSHCESASLLLSSRHSFFAAKSNTHCLLLGLPRLSCSRYCNKWIGVKTEAGGRGAVLLDRFWSSHTTCDCAITLVLCFLWALASILLSFRREIEGEEGGRRWRWKRLSNLILSLLLARKFKALYWHLLLVQGYCKFYCFSDFW